MTSRREHWNRWAKPLLGRARVLFLLLALFGAGARVTAAEPAPRVGDGAAITPEFARSLFDRFKELQEADGCRLAQFNTQRFRVTITLSAPSGALHSLDLSSASPGAGARSAGKWSLAVPEGLQRECGATLAVIENVLGTTAVPRRTFELSEATRRVYELLAGAFVVLCAGTAVVLIRETRRLRPAAVSILALALISLLGLLLRLFLSPRTFLHEYYHIAETVPAYLTGTVAPLYGKTGPALFRLAAAVTGAQDVQVIFVTNAIIASLAIPALALLDLALLRQWPRALCSALLLCVFPLHLRFSAAEDLFVQAVTFGLWTLALFALYLQSGRLLDALLCGVALALTMQVRPEMLTFPAVLVALVLVAQPRSWRLLLRWRSMAALLLALVLLVPRLIELREVFAHGSPAAALPDLGRYLRKLVLFHADVTPPIYWLVLAAGAAWSLRHARGLMLWAGLIYGGYTLTALSLFDNPPYNLRSQILPSSLLLLVGGATASMWTALTGGRRRTLRWGAGALAAFAALVLLSARGFVRELRDQQLEWAFLERTVPRLPQRATLLTAVEFGGNNLNAFPRFLLDGEQKTFDLVDLRRVVSGEGAWPAPHGELLYYQGMFCFFALEPTARVDPMTDLCQAVHDRYVLEPLFEETLHTTGYSHLYYARGPYRVGFFRATRLRAPR